MNHKAPQLRLEKSTWFQAIRNITNITNERTFISAELPRYGMGHSATVVEYERVTAVASTLVLANMNSLPLDWAARVSVGGSNLSIYIVKQLPVLPPEVYLEHLDLPSATVLTYAEIIVPRALELTYTSHALAGFARNLGYNGPPFLWDEMRRHCLKSELDAIYAHMYGLERDEIDYMLDAPAPNSIFLGLKRDEIKKFGEFRTKRLVLSAYDQLTRGELPKLDTETCI